MTRPALALIPLALACAAPAAAQQQQQQDIGVGVELVLAVDASRSMDFTEQMIQRRGYAEAFRSTDVQGAIMNGGWGRVAVTYVEWAGPGWQTVLIPWTLIDGPDSAEAFARAIEAGGMGTYSRTSISAALDYSAGLFEGNGFQGMRRVIDISGDGPNNQGRPVTQARDAAIRQGIVINGLPLMTNGRDDGFGGWANIDDLDHYFRDCVIGGPGSFYIPVTGWDQFAAAVRQKLVLELAEAQPPERLILAQAEPPVDCMIGERLWQRRQEMRWD